MRILIVEDEVKTALYLRKGLTASGYTVDITHDGEEGLYLAIQNHYELVILDIMLPKRDGWSILSGIRHAAPQTRVLFLTARNQIEDRVKGLELGADDYLVKPFAFSELLARVRSQLRRKTVVVAEVLTVADLTLDLVRHQVKRRATAIDLTAKEFSLLGFFMRHAGEVLTRTLIAEQVWDINFDTDTNVIDVLVRRLRQKIDDPFEKKLLHTVRGIGYVLDER
jgi:two-component system copper resistance phosphate regulon response regulator CusR